MCIYPARFKSFTTKQVSNSSTDQGSGKWRSKKFRQRLLHWRYSFLSFQRYGELAEGIGFAESKFTVEQCAAANGDHSKAEGGRMVAYTRTQAIDTTCKSDRYRSLTVQLSPDTYDRISAIAKEHELSKSEAGRKILEWFAKSCKWTEVGASTSK
jgi:hypothetical protein